MKGKRKDKHCVKCGKKLDREGEMCQRCHLKSFLKTRKRYARESRQATAQLKAMKKAVYDKILKEVNIELDREERKRK